MNHFLFLPTYSHLKAVLEEREQSLDEQLIQKMMSEQHVDRITARATIMTRVELSVRNFLAH